MEDNIRIVTDEDIDLPFWIAAKRRDNGAVVPRLVVLDEPTEPGMHETSVFHGDGYFTFPREFFVWIGKRPSDDELKFLVEKNGGAHAMTRD